jgi:hypothetical protein
MMPADRAPLVAGSCRRRCRTASQGPLASVFTAGSPTRPSFRRLSMNSAAGLLCPTCRVSLVMSERSGIEIDYCPQCRGIWLDRGELDKIIERSRPRERSRAPAAATGLCAVAAVLPAAAAPSAGLRSALRSGSPRLQAQEVVPRGTFRLIVARRQSRGGTATGAPFFMSSKTAVPVASLPRAQVEMEMVAVISVARPEYSGEILA